MSTPWEEQIEEGQAALRQRRHADAEAHFQAALDLARASDQRAFLEPTTLEHLAEVSAARGRRDAAEQHYREVLRLRRAHLGDEHQDVARTLFDLAGIEMAKQDFAAAERCFREAERVAVAVHGEAAPDVATVRHALGTLFVLRKDFAQAIPLLEQALPVREADPSLRRFEAMTTRILLAECYEAVGRLAEAAAESRAVHHQKVELLGAGHRGLMGTLENLSRVEEALDHPAAALAAEEELLAIREAAMGGHPLTLQSLKDVARLAVTGEDYARAAECYRRLVTLDEKVLGPRHPGLVEDLEYLVELLDYLGSADEAAVARQQLAKVQGQGR